MAKIIKVTPEELKTTANKINSLAEDYKSLYNQFYIKTSDMKSAWKGEDNTAYIEQIDGFRDDFEAMHAELVEYANFLQTSAKAYIDTQDNRIVQAKNLVKDR